MQVNRNMSTFHVADSTEADTSRDAARDARRIIKKIARNINSDVRKLGRQGFLSTDVEKLTGIHGRFADNQARLAELSARGLDGTAPPQTVARKLRSAIVLGGGVVGHSGAIVGATVAGVVEGGRDSCNGTGN